MNGQDAASPGTDHQTYIAIETAISVLISGFLSLLFAWLIFGGRTHADLWGASGLAIDFVPQSFMIALMGSLVPTLLTRSRLKRGKITAMAASSKQGLPENPFVRALAIAMASTVAGSMIAIILLSILMSGPLPVFPVYAIKIAYGCILAAVVTPISLRRALSPSPVTKQQG